MTRRRVVVTGLGATTPLGGDVATTWAGLLAGKSGVRSLTEEWAQTIPVTFAARVAVEPSEQMERVEIRRLDRSEQFGLIASREAWKDAGSPEIDKERLGVVVASGIGGVTTLLEQYDVLTRQVPKSWRTSNGNFHTEGRGNLEIKSFEYSGSKEGGMCIQPDIVE